MLTTILAGVGGIIVGAVPMGLARAHGVREERRARTEEAEGRAGKAEAQLKDAWAEIDQLKHDIRFDMVRKGGLDGVEPGEVLINETRVSRVESLDPFGGTVRVLRKDPHWSACCKHCRNTFDVTRVRRETRD